MAVSNIAIPKGYNDSFIFVPTDGGVYVTDNGGLHWERPGMNLPYVIVYDILFDSTNTKMWQPCVKDRCCKSKMQKSKGDGEIRLEFAAILLLFILKI